MERDGTGEATFRWQGSEGSKDSVIDWALIPGKASIDMVVIPVWEQTTMYHKALGVWVHLQGEG